MTGYESKRAAAQDKLAQPAQEPVTWSGVDFDINTAPPQRQPLTDEQIKDVLIRNRAALPLYLCFARAIEAAHGIKEKNNG